MRTHVEFRSDYFPAYEGEEGQINPGRFEKRLAEFIASDLPRHGFKVSGVEAEDWGWMIQLENDAFPLWIGCGNYEEYPDGFLCFIEPSKPFIRKWFSKIDTTETVERVASALDAILSASGKVAHQRWWSEADAHA